MGMIYNPKFGWQEVRENAPRPVAQTKHRIVSENSLQSLEQLVIQLLATKTTDPNTILGNVQQTIKKWQADEWHRTQGQPQGQPGMDINAPGTPYSPHERAAMSTPNQKI
jgi:hypothetical protein